ncbi:hypothetical protein AXG55_12500 [Silvanigrella aquatica]|uniref:ABC transporter ATP-binding protein n=1 Tax=Silvanigrella aquatica TaxID=1915309 RepID=A0A1L4D4R6_9BACT|nr:hypothetical protein AXG55_12500 [Silvanigrella aquatica]
MKSLFLKILLMRIHMRFFVFIMSLIATVFSLSVPYYQKEFLDGLLKNSVNISHEIIIFLLLIFGFSMLSQLSVFISKIFSYFEGSYIQKWLSHETYSKTLVLKADNPKKMSAGQALSVYATDVYTACTLIDDVIPNIISYILPILLAPVAIIIMTSINPMLIIVVILSILTLNCLMAIKQGKYFFHNKMFAAIRIGHVNEWLQNMRVIRMLGWTESLEKKIKYSRIKETNNRLAMVTNGSTMNSIGYSAPFFINIIAVFLLIKLEGNKISSGQIFSLLWIFGVLLTRPLRMLPIMLVSITDCYTSIKRVQNYWNQETEKDEVQMKNNNLENTNSEGCDLEIKNLSYKYEGKLLLDNISIVINKNEFVAIIGEVGSGKSLILQALLKIISSECENYKINNESTENMDLNKLRSYFSYVPQDIFIVNSNLRDNVAFEYDYQKNNDNEIIKCLEMSQFNFQTENIKLGLNTEIGERGVNLSGGQKQRVAIARACYANCPIILLDDCLSALDVNTEEKINESLLNGHWKNKTRILATHRLSILPKCDRVLFIKNGKIVENGKFYEIYERSNYVRDFVSTLSE